MKTKDPLAIYTGDNSIILKKYVPQLTCAVTGKMSKDNMILADGKLILSPEGAKILLEQIEAERRT